jgi:6-phospho-3-hexuloisomerase
MQEILKELGQLNATLSEAEVNQFADILLTSYGKKIVGLGAGRMGYSLQAFMMRLSHLGFKSFMIGDTALPRIGPEDIVVVNSSSGETPTILLLTQIAKSNGATILVITKNRSSSLVSLADYKIVYGDIDTSQMMKTIYEQFSFLLFDLITSKLAKNVPLSIEQIEKNHSVLE